MKSLVRLTTLVALVAMMLIGSSAALAQDSTNPLCNGLTPEDCAILEGAAATSMGLTSFEAPSYSITLNIDTGEEGGKMDFSATGSAAFMFPTDMTNPLDGLMVYLQIDDASFNDGTTTEQGTATVLVKDGMAYINYEGEWYGEEITEEDVAEMGLEDITGMAAGLDAESLGMDLTGVISTVRGADADMMGQSVATFQSTVNITTLVSAVLGSPMIGNLLGSELGMEGMTPEDMQMVGMMIAPMLTGSSITVDQWVGLDDSQIHNIVLDIAFNLDMTMFDPEAAPIVLAVNFSSEVANHNGTFDYEAPAEYRPGSELNVDIGAVESLELGM